MTPNQQDLAGPEPRRPHTFYLTASMWAELERRYFEQRLAGGTLSKIAFLEELLRSGLAESSTRTKPQAVAARGARVEASTPPDPAGSTSAATSPAADTPTPPRAKPKTTPATSRPPRAPVERSSALNRLREASDPGRPPPIDSAAPLREPPTE
ncbi:MAG: hypothetical protein QOI20_3472 [Acidimicrobiaceae bacterium]|nr:hypothetical protein [Acidimicrobiaceae bacterium]